MSMTIETVECDKCGKKHRIETDDHKFLADRKAEFEKSHKDCKDGK